MLLFGSKNDVISKLKKKKVFSEISTVFPAEIKCSPKEITLFTRDFDGPLNIIWMGPLSSSRAP